jgi:VanZ family protein
MLHDLFYFGPRGVGRGDAVANVALFVPFGFLAMQCVSDRRDWRSWLAILAVAFVLAHSIQTMQLILPGRVPSGSDSVLNLIGCALGCLLGMLSLPGRLSSDHWLGHPMPIPTLLAVGLLLWNFRPFVPSLDLGLVVDNVKWLIASPLPHPVWTLQAVVTWLLVFHFLETGGANFARESQYTLLVALILASGLFIVESSITIDRILGAFLALLLWYRTGWPRKPRVLFMLTLLLVILISFTPFELRSEPSRFHWIPFSGALGGSMIINVLAIIKKLLMYGCLIYLLCELGFRLWASTLAISVFLLVSEFLQVFFQGRTPEITDSLLALMIGGVFHLWQQHNGWQLRSDALPAKDRHT